MIIVLASGRVPGGRRPEYLQAVAESGAVRATRLENGCLNYDVSASANDPDTIYIVERWGGFPALKEHMMGENMACLNDVNAKFGVAYQASLYKAEPMG